MPPKEGQEEALKRMAKIVNAFINHADSGPFREPVDWRGLELYDYPEIVKKMMDLGTIARKLERNQYTTAWECAQDVRLVWKNCMTYNASGSDFWLLAKSLSRKFEDRFRRLKNEFDVGEMSDDHEGESEEEDEDDDDDDEDDEEEDDEIQDEDDEEEEFMDGDDDERRPSSRSSNGPRLSNASAMSSNGSVTSSGGGGGGGASNSNNNNTGNGGGPASLDARATLAANLLLLQGTELGHVLMTLERECPAALEVNDAKNNNNSKNGSNNNGNKSNCNNNSSVPEKLEIVLDVLEGPVFTKIAQYAQAMTEKTK